MSSFGLGAIRQSAGFSTAPPPAASIRHEASGAVDNPCATPGKIKIGRDRFSMPTVLKKTFRSVFSDTHHSWQVAVSEGGTCTRRLRIECSKRSTFTALASSPRVRLRSTTNTQGLPSYRLTILPSQNASGHVPNAQFITLGDAT